MQAVRIWPSARSQILGCGGRSCTIAAITDLGPPKPLKQKLQNLLSMAIETVEMVARQQ